MGCMTDKLGFVELKFIKNVWENHDTTSRCGPFDLGRSEGIERF